MLPLVTDSLTDHLAEVHDEGVGTLIDMPSDKQAAMTAALGEDVIDYIRRRKSDGLSFNRIAVELEQLTGRPVTGETLRVWDKDAPPSGNGDPA